MSASTQSDQDLSRREEMSVSSAAMSAAPWGAATVTGGGEGARLQARCPGEGIGTAEPADGREDGSGGGGAKTDAGGGSWILEGGRVRVCRVSARRPDQAVPGGCSGTRGGPGRGSAGRAGRAAARAAGCRR